MEWTLEQPQISEFVHFFMALMGMGEIIFIVIFDPGKSAKNKREFFYVFQTEDPSTVGLGIFMTDLHGQIAKSTWLCLS